MKQGIRICIFGNLAIGCLATSPPLSAQIVPDATLPVNSVVTPQGNTLNITGGTSAGGNLFHSFREFSLPAGTAAHFNNSLAIQNIITRVTGGAISNIDGIIRANGTANLFLLNPSGIIFGPNASLKIGGSFIGTTASSIKFADGNEFSATNPAAPPLLTVNLPVGLQMGQNPGEIVVRGAGHNISSDPDTGATILENRPAGLQVSAGLSLALVGGDISLVGGNITAEEGRIDLLSAGALSYVSLTPNSAGWLLDDSGVRNFQDIQLSQAASTDVSGSGSGAIQVRGRRVTLSEGSVIIGQTKGGSAGGSLSVRGAESVELIGRSADSQLPIPSGLFSEVSPGATGIGGNVTVETGRLTLRDGARIAAATSGAGDGGTLTVRAAESADLIGSSLSARVIPGATGKGGNVTVETGRLTLRDGAQIGAGTFGAGDGGTLTVLAAESVNVIGTSANGLTLSILSTSTQPGSTGNGGDLRIETGRLTVRDGAQISAGTLGAGDGGALTVRATDSVELIGTLTNRQAFSLSTLAGGDLTGNGGDLRVETGRLLLRDGAAIAASTYGAGNAGTLTVRARESVDMIGSYLFTAAELGSTGKGGDLTVETGRLTLADGAQINASTSGAGDAGRLTVRARESTDLIGTTANGQFPSGLLAISGPNSTGSGGDLTVETGRLTLRDGAQISTETFGAGNAGMLTVRATESVDLIYSDLIAIVRPGATGFGGDLTVETGRLTLRDGAQISTSTLGAGDAGTLRVGARESAELIGIAANGKVASSLSASADSGSTGNGGDLIVETGRLTVRDGAQIGAATFSDGNAGTLTVRARESVEVIGTSADGRAVSGLFASGEGGSTGNGGDLRIETGRLTVRDRATIDATSVGTGAAGNLTVSASAIRLDSQASVSANTQGGGGNIILNAGTIQLRRNSAITTNATESSSGGNITFTADTIAALENSDISANSQESAGGKVTINAQGIFGTEYRLAPTSNSDITATGGSPQLNGTVTINTPDANPTSGLIQLPSQLHDVTGLINNPCTPLARGSSFTVTGRGGIPQSPTDPLTGTALAVDWISPPTAAPAPPTLSQEIPKSPNPGSPPPLIEAQGWIISSTGTVTLTANPPNGTPHSFWQVPANCPAIQ